MQLLEANLIKVADNDDVVKVRARVRDAASQLGFSNLDQVRLVTAASELARNIRLYAERGSVEIAAISGSGRKGLRIRFEDHGPGIADIDLAMKDGYTTSRGMGKGLPGSRRLVDDFQIESTLGEGTIVVIIKWL